MKIFKTLSVATATLLLFQVVPFYPITTPPAVPEAQSQTLAIGQVTAQTTLSGTNEVPPNSSTAMGAGTFAIDTAANTVSFNITFSGLSGAELGAHIHGPAAAGENAGIIFTLPLGSPKTGMWNYIEAQEADILAGRTYVNIHSPMFPGGEIRGQIVP